MQPSWATPFPRLLSKGRSRTLVWLVANGFAQGACALGIAFAIRAVFDRFIGPGVSPSVVTMTALAAAFVCLHFGAAWLRMVERVGAERLGQSFAYSIRARLFDHMSRLSLRAHRSRRHGALFLRFVGDLTAIRQWVSLGLARLLVAGVTTGVVVVVVLIFDWRLGLIVVGAMGIGAAISGWRGIALEQSVRDVRRRRSFLSSNISEKISQMPVVGSNGQVAMERKRMLKQARRLMDASIGRAAIIGQIRGIVALSTGLSAAAILLFSTMLQSSGSITPGAVVAALAIIGFLSPQIRDIGRVYEYWHGARVSKEKIVRYLSSGPTIQFRKDAQELERGPFAISFENVTVRGALDGFSAKVEPNSVVAITGGNGAGKSTLLFLLQRLIDPDEGAIHFGTQRISDLERTSLAQAVSCVSADLPLLRGTVERNLRYRDATADERSIEKICDLCGATEVIESLPDGMKTKLTEQGNNLSLGQRHRLMLARALVGSPRLLLLDEAEANLDRATRDAFRRAISSFPGTVLMVTHTDDWLSCADRIWRLEAGRLVSDRPSPHLADNVLPYQPTGASSP